MRGRALLWADALGLALFAVVGTGKALDAGVPALSAIVLGTVTATFGGIIRDTLAGMTPLVLRQEIYVTAAALGAAVMVGLIALGVEPAIGASAGFAASFILRALALLRGWSLPAFPLGITQGRIHAVDDVAETREDLGALRNPGDPYHPHIAVAFEPDRLHHDDRFAGRGIDGFGDDLVPILPLEAKNLGTLDRHFLDALVRYQSRPREPISLIVGLRSGVSDMARMTTGCSSALKVSRGPS